MSLIGQLFQIISEIATSTTLINDLVNRSILSYPLLIIEQEIYEINCVCNDKSSLCLWVIILIENVQGNVYLIAFNTYFQ